MYARQTHCINNTFIFLHIHLLHKACSCYKLSTTLPCHLFIVGVASQPFNLEALGSIPAQDKIFCLYYLLLIIIFLLFFNLYLFIYLFTVSPIVFGTYQSNLNIFFLQIMQFLQVKRCRACLVLGWVTVFLI